MYLQVKKHLPQPIKRSLKSLVDIKTFYQIKTARVHPAPIFILGHAKSGTTAIASLLSKATGQPVTIDPLFRIDPDGDLQQQLFSQELHLDELVQAYKFYFSTPINKDPKLTFFYDELCQCFPLAKFIFVIRDPRDNIRSFLNRRGIPGNLDKLPEDKHQWIGNLPPIAGKNYIEKLANRWNLAADTYLNHQDKFTLSRYEDFARDKVGTIHSLAKEVGLIPSHDISDYVNLEYQPSGDRQVSWSEFFKTENLNLIETICSQRMNFFGYSLSSV
jgi:hypothetical protein